MANAVTERYVLDDIHNGLASSDGGNVVLDFVDPDGSGAQAIAMSKRYLYGEAVDQLFAQEDLSKTLGDAARNLWPLVDNLGTVRDLAKQDGTIAVHYKYDSFGNVTSGDTSQTRYLFTSREFDPATKLQSNRARYFDAAVGRWASEDPLGFAAGDLNSQRYVANGATHATDPSGLADGFWDSLTSQIKEARTRFMLARPEERQRLGLPGGRHPHLAAGLRGAATVLARCLSTIQRPTGTLQRRE
jgi:RHS repeat-associated protein